MSDAIAPTVAPPLMVLALIEMALMDGGNTVNCNVAVPEFSVAVRVTGVAEVTCPA